MIRSNEKESFLENGYLHVPQIVESEHLERIREAFDEVWDTNRKCNQLVLLKHGCFLDLIEHPPIIERHQALFGRQIQLLQYDLLGFGPESNFPERSWHRDFSFPGDRPVSANTILYLDDMPPERGQTRVIPGSHREEFRPPQDERKQQPMEGEVAIEAQAGDAVFINSALWHTAARNLSNGKRRGVYLYYGYWWIKRYESDQALPSEAIIGASEQRLRLLGLKQPDRCLQMYDPKLGFPELQD